MISPEEWRLKLDLWVPLRSQAGKCRPWPFPCPAVHFLWGSTIRAEVRNEAPCLVFKIQADRYSGVKGKHAHTNVVLEFGERCVPLLMQLKIGTCVGVCLFLSFLCFFPLDKMASSKDLFSLKWTPEAALSLANQSYLLRFTALSVCFRFHQLWLWYKMS